MPEMSRFALIALLGLALQGCASLGYYAQAVHGQMDLLARRQPIDGMLTDPATPPALQAKLARVLEIRAFASRDLGLPDNPSYTLYADLGRPFVVWSVFAAPEFSLDPVQSCFPLIGCVAYRAYFAEQDAQTYAAALRAQGNDVFVAGVPAYSTLGWFDDPVLAGMLDWPETYLAGVIFHELAHQLLYLPDDSVFNESFATLVEEVGTDRWLASGCRREPLPEPVEKPLPELVEGSVPSPGSVPSTSSGNDCVLKEKTYRRAQAQEAQFIEFIGEIREQLAALYRRALPAGAMRAEKRVILDAAMEKYARLKADCWNHHSGLDFWVEGGLDNARLLPWLTYHGAVPGLRALLAQVGEDLPAFYAAARELGNLPPAARHAHLLRLAAARNNASAPPPQTPAYRTHPCEISPTPGP